MTDRSFTKSRVRTPTAGHDPDKRRRLVEAAARAFARSGFDRASVDGIARDAGVAKGTTYLYFANKRALLLAALDELRARLDAAPAAGAAGAAEERLRSFVRLHLDVARDAPDLFRCYTSALFGVNRDFQEAALRVFAWQTERAAIALRGGGERGSRALTRRAELVAGEALAAALVRSLRDGPQRGSSMEEEMIVHGALEALR